MTKSGDVWKLDKLVFRADTSILGVSAQLQFSYSDGKVDSAAAAFSVNKGIGPANLGAGALFAYHAQGAKLTGADCKLDANTRLEASSAGKQLYIRLCGQIKLGFLHQDLRFTFALPHKFTFSFDTGKVNIPLGPASIHIQAALSAVLELRVGPPAFYIESGRAHAGGCLNLILWRGCGDAIHLDFKPDSGFFEGTFLGFAVRWGYPAWKVSKPVETPEPEPAPAPPSLGGSQRKIPFLRSRAGVLFRISGSCCSLQQASKDQFDQSGVFWDPVKRELIMDWCLSPAGPHRCKHLLIMQVRRFGASDFDPTSKLSASGAHEVTLIEAGDDFKTPRTQTFESESEEPVVCYSEGHTALKDKQIYCAVNKKLTETKRRLPGEEQKQPAVHLKLPIEARFYLKDLPGGLESHPRPLPG
jgi:hypothetical protein